MKNRISFREKLQIPLGANPPASNTHVSKVMKANRAKNTGPELAVRKALWSSGLRGYRLHWPKAPGRPDICYPGKKVAVFVNGCFWHRCPHCSTRIPKTHTDFWKRKFERNIERDRLKIERLEEQGWKVIIIWECQIRNRVEDALCQLRSCLSDAHA